MDDVEGVQDAGYWRHWIVTDPDVLADAPRIRGTRISVALLLDRLRDGWSYGDILASYPHLTAAQVDAAVRFAAEHPLRSGE